MKKHHLLTLVFSIQASLAWACFCVPIPTFCESMIDSAGIIQEEYTVIKIEITNKTVTGIDVKIKSVLFGASNSGELFINKGDENLCTINTDIFSEGEIYIFSFYNLNTAQNLFLSDCGIHYLKIENEVVIGPIAPNIESISFDEFNTIECFEDFEVSISDISPLKNSFSVFPNPNDGNFYISNFNEIKVNQIIEMELIDLQGRTIYRNQKTDGWLPNEEWRINVSEITNGVYFLRIFVEEKSAVLKIVKM